MATLVPASLLLGLGLGLVQITNLTRQARVGSRVGLGRVAGVTPLVATLGSITGNLGGGLLGNAIGLQNVFFVLGGTSLLYLLLTLLPASAEEPEPSRREAATDFGMNSTSETIGLD